VKLHKLEQEILVNLFSAADILNDTLRTINIFENFCSEIKNGQKYVHKFKCKSKKSSLKSQVSIVVGQKYANTFNLEIPELL
jgi:hypothetical protein